MIINKTLIKCIKPSFEYKGVKLDEIGNKLTYNDYICLEKALINADTKVVYKYLKTILGYKCYNKPKGIKKYAILKGLNKTMQNIEKAFYKSTKPTKITAKELGCGFEEINEKWRHSLRLDAVANKAGISVFEAGKKTLNEIYSWYSLVKAEQSAEAVYSKKLEDNAKR